MSSAIVGPPVSRNLFMYSQFVGFMIAAQVPMIAIPEQIRCKRGQPPRAVSAGNLNPLRSESPSDKLRGGR